MKEKDIKPNRILTDGTFIVETDGLYTKTRGFRAKPLGSDRYEWYLNIENWWDITDHMVDIQEQLEILKKPIQKPKNRIKLTIEVELEDHIYDESFDETELEFFMEEVMTTNGTLLLHSNEVGDTIGTIIKIEDLTFL